MIKVISSQLLPSDIIIKLKELGIECIPGGSNPFINNETAYHPDMLYFKLTNGKLLSAIKNTPSVNNLDIIVAKVKVEDGYPKDCALNCFFAKNCLICGPAVAEEIIEDAKLSGLDICRVKQGYAACSTVKVTDSAFISSDKGIVKALKSQGCDALWVSNNGILLKGYNNGFIGGCSISTKSFIGFTGDISAHENFNEIESFIKNYGKSIFSLSENKLYDYGGFIVL